MQDPSLPRARSKPPRFSWPVQLLVSFLVFDIVFHSVASLSGYRDWMEKKDLPNFPRRLPTNYEIQNPDEEDPAGDRALRALDSVWDYLRPWPDKSARGKLEGPWDYAAFELAWVASRLDLFENMVGAPQRWTMFSPNASRGCWVARFRLVFADETTEVVRITGDPEDLTNYTHWFEEKILDAELKVSHDYDSRLGYCSYLAHKHAKNAAGSPLQMIYIYKVGYDYPNPGDDIAAVFSAQTGPPNWDRGGPKWSYDPVTTRDDPHGQLRKLKDDERLRVRDRLDQMSQQTVSGD